jgi:hypothetical protein
MITSRLTIITPAETHDLVSIAAARLALGVANTSQDAAIAGWVRQASDVVARHCGRVFALETVSETFRLSAPVASVPLARAPVASITSIEENGETLAADAYEFNVESGLVTRLGSGAPTLWPRGAVTIVYAGGYSLPEDLPDDIARASLVLVRHYHGGPADPLLRRVELDGVGARDYFPPRDGTPPEVEALLAPHRSLTVG